jgi:hypothetical protein
MPDADTYSSHAAALDALTLAHADGDESLERALREWLDGQPDLDEFTEEMSDDEMAEFAGVDKETHPLNTPYKTPSGQWWMIKDIGGGKKRAVRAKDPGAQQPTAEDALVAPKAPKPPPAPKPTPEEKAARKAAKTEEAKKAKQASRDEKLKGKEEAIAHHTKEAVGLMHRMLQGEDVGHEGLAKFNDHLTNLTTAKIRAIRELLGAPKGGKAKQDQITRLGDWARAQAAKGAGGAPKPTTPEAKPVAPEKPAAPASPPPPPPDLNQPQPGEKPATGPAEQPAPEAKPVVPAAQPAPAPTGQSELKPHVAALAKTGEELNKLQLQVGDTINAAMDKRIAEKRRATPQELEQEQEMWHGFLKKARDAMDQFKALPLADKKALAERLTGRKARSGNDALLNFGSHIQGVLNQVSSQWS